MKILIINKFLHPNGGSETYIFEVGKQLEKMGHEVQYFGMEHKGRIVGNRAESYVRDMDFHTGKLEKVLYPFKIIYSVEARKKLRTVLEDFWPDVVHLNNFNFQLTPSILYEIRKFGKEKGERISVVFTAHDSQLVCPNHLMRIPSTGENCDRCLERGFGECTKNRCIHDSKIKSLLGSMEGWLYKKMRTYRYIDRIICPSQFMKQKFDTNPIFCDKTIVLHNFVNLLPKESAGDERRENGEYILYFGRYSEEKGIHLLLNACRELPEISFVFAGNGPLEQEVERTENVKNVGFQSGSELAGLIRGALFSICPSGCYENCPFSVMESISYGTPVIGSDIGGIPELIKEGVTGELFRSGDKDELSRKIWELWNNRGKLAEYTENCENEKFDTVEEYCGKILTIYSNVDFF